MRNNFAIPFFPYLLQVTVFPSGHPGAVCEEPAATWDLLPTFCGIAETTTPDQPLDGVDLTPLLRQPVASLDRQALYFHYPHYHHSRPASAIRQDDFKLIEWLEDGSVELYNLKTDIGESKDLATTMPARVEKMRHDLTSWRHRVGARMPTRNAKHDPKKSDVWWNRRNGVPLDLSAIGDRLEQSASKPYFRTN